MFPVALRRSHLPTVVAATLALLAVTPLVVACAPPRDKAPTPRPTTAATAPLSRWS
jgi:hypothetical protein